MLLRGPLYRIATEVHHNQVLAGMDRDAVSALKRNLTIDLVNQDRYLAPDGAGAAGLDHGVRMLVCTLRSTSSEAGRES
ncbi:MAG: hypothetical protein ABR570_06475 [Burkholderiales bacterium]